MFTLKATVTVCLLLKLKMKYSSDWISTQDKSYKTSLFVTEDGGVGSQILGIFLHLILPLILPFPQLLTSFGLVSQPVLT